ncbi:MAG: hypothetical protein HY287_02545 [Planctomycetes bacterium]|nr:hypothetical protein [Planctomycetota bacterium]MBI3833189.1 hypothetical protein [Planctomycetota bacterium]
MAKRIERLLVFPGLSSPYHEKYIPSYDLLRDRANSLGIACQIVLYPGQQSQDGKRVGELTPNGAFEAAAAVLRSAEAKAEPFATLGISFGCTVSLLAAIGMSETKYWIRAILWGPIPHSLMCRTFVEERDKLLGSGTTIAKTPDNSRLHLNPIEELLKQVRIPVTVGVGRDDRYVSPEYVLWLQQVSGKGIKPPFHTFVCVEGCDHNVVISNPNYRGYLDMVFAGLQ